MRACSALVVHSDARFRIRVGGLMRRSLHPVFLVADADSARALIEERPSVALVAVAEQAGGEELLADLMSRRPSLGGFVLSGAESEEPGPAGLDARLNALLEEAELHRERRLRDLMDRRMRRRIARAADRLAGERVAALSRLAATGTGVR
jgi:hypothetical protein